MVVKSYHSPKLANTFLYDIQRLNEQNGKHSAIENVVILLQYVGTWNSQGWLWND